jgi:hypothetical protein
MGWERAPRREKASSSAESATVVLDEESKEDGLSNKSSSRTLRGVRVLLAFAGREAGA